MSKAQEYKKLTKGRKFRIVHDLDTGVYTVGFWNASPMHSGSLASGDISASGQDLSATVQRFFEHFIVEGDG